MIGLFLDSLIDTFKEVYTAMCANKLRTFLTGFAIFWGMLIFIILLGSGNAVKNAALSNFGDRAANKIIIYSGKTSVPYRGYKNNRQVYFTNREVDILKTKFSQIKNISGIAYKYKASINYNGKTTTCDILGVVPEYEFIVGLKIQPEHGFFLKDVDVEQNRRVAVLSKSIVDILFDNAFNSLGKIVQINGLPFQVIGIDSKKYNYSQNLCYVPQSTLQSMNKVGPGVERIAIFMNNLDTQDQIKIFKQNMQKTLRNLLNIAPNDFSAIEIWDQTEDYLSVLEIFKKINLFVWLVSMCTMLAGAVGVGNIILISVNERTKEFGIRKALGATPKNIVFSILSESIIMTIAFGSLGIATGISLLRLVDKFTHYIESLGKIFKDPSVNLFVILMAIGILLITGLIAGYIPAKRAVIVKPIEAIRVN